MLKPIEKLDRQLVHHPSDVLDDFCHCDSTSRAWLDFDDRLSFQLLELEFQNRRYIRLRLPLNRRAAS